MKHIDSNKEFRQVGNAMPEPATLPFVPPWPSQFRETDAGKK